VSTDSTDEREATLRQAHRYLEDLLLFEGERFIAPPGVPKPVVTHPAEIQVEAGDGPTSDPAAELEGFRDQICTCMNCSLGQTRHSFVFGTGNPQAGIMFIGEAPGADEDRQGVPFVGKAGQLLTKIIEAIHLKRDDVYICNMLKCRPPNNRDPLPEEIAECEPYLKRQIEIVKPKIICTLGRIATQAILRTTGPMRALRGKLHQYEGIPVIVTYHPAALLRNPSLKRDAWEDVKWLRREYDGTEI
jgi:uracil-DNA glycosylase family 4